MKLNSIFPLGAGHFEASVKEPISTSSAGSASRLLGAASASSKGRGKGAFCHLFKLRSNSAAYAAFVATVLAGLLAAATVVSNDLPLVLGGL